VRRNAAGEALPTRGYVIKGVPRKVEDFLGIWYTLKRKQKTTGGLTKMAVKVINKDNFEETINCGKTVVVDFFATWCGPCKMLAPILEEVSEELPDDHMIAKLDIDQNVELARRYGVMSVPTVVAFKKGKAVSKMIGLRPKEDVLKFLEMTDNLEA